MTRMKTAIFLAALAAILPPMSAAAPPQDKFLSEIAGDYELQLNARTLPFKILLKEGKLYFDALVPGGESSVMSPVQAKDLTFTSYDPNDDEIVITFAKDPQGKITGCTVYVPVRNAEAKAVKIVKI